MAGPLALEAEVRRGRHDAGAEEEFPDAVDGDPGGERVLLHDEPLREAETIGGRSGGQGGKFGGGACFDLHRGLGVVAPVQDERLARLGGEVHHHRRLGFGEALGALLGVGQVGAHSLHLIGMLRTIGPQGLLLFGGTFRRLALQDAQDELRQVGAVVVAGEGEKFTLAGGAAHFISEIDLRGQVGLFFRGDRRGERQREVMRPGGRRRRPALVEHVECAHVLRRIVLGPGIGGDPAELLEAMDVHLVAGDLIGGDVDGGEHEAPGERIHGLRRGRSPCGGFRGLGRLRVGERVGEDEAQSGNGGLGLRGFAEDIVGGLGDAFELIAFDGEAAAAIGRGDLEQVDRDESEPELSVGFP